MKIPFFICMLYAVCVLALKHTEKPPELAKVQTYTQHTYYPEGYCSDGKSVFKMRLNSLVIQHFHEAGSPYGTFCYTGRWAGEYFIARQNDTISQVNLDSAMVFPRCCPAKYTK